MSTSASSSIDPASVSSVELLQSPLGPREVWRLDPNVCFLNHGSFGSCPHPVREVQDEYRRRLESEPIDFLVRELEPLLDDARTKLAAFVGGRPENLVFVTNATAGVNTVLRSLRFQPGDELLVTDQEYNACRNALNYVAEVWGAQVVVATVPFPISGPQEWVDAITSKITPRTRLALFDHVTSQTGLVAPMDAVLRALRERGVLSLVDGAHAPGMTPLTLDASGPDFYTGNCHKWLCAPKTAAFLYVRPEHHEKIRPLIISHGANSARKDRSRLQIEFAWTGTHDPSSFLAVPAALEFMASLLPGGWPALMARNRALCVAARRQLCASLAIEPPAPESLLGSMAALPIPNAQPGRPLVGPLFIDALQDELRFQHQIEIPVIPWPSHPRRILRLSAQAYNSLPQYERLGAAAKRCEAW